MGFVDQAVRTTDVDEAAAFLSELYPVARFEAPRSPFVFAQRVRGDEGATLARFVLSAPCDVTVDFTGVIGIGHLISGDYRARSGRDELDVTGPFLFRPQEGSSVSENLDIRLVNLDEAALTRFAGDRYGLEGARLRIADTRPLSETEASMWMQTVDYARHMMSVPGTIENALLRSAITEMLFAAALSAFPISVSGISDVKDADTTLPSVVRRALAYMEENAHRPIGVSDIAAAVRVGVRSLQAAFRRHLDTTPHAALRAVRLAAVREDLLASEVTDEGVTAIARRWGFHHQGRFAAEYRDRFGELPRETLRR